MDSGQVHKGAAQAVGVAIPFIKYDPENQRFEVTRDAVEFLQQIEGKIGVVAVCGKYRTGKSYLLNKLFLENLNFEQEADVKSQTFQGFQVGPTINPCTKGLWIWKKVFYTEKDGEQLPIIIVDTEGLGAFDEEQNHDTKIFLLALLMSSLLVYNSMGAIDENALNNLSLVVNLSKSLQIKRGHKDLDPDELAMYFPSFLWILRDFALRLEDQQGNCITQKDYLEQSLQEQKGMSDAIEQKNRVRRLVRHFFQDRDCHTVVRPIEEEKKLQMLNDIGNDSLRSEFIQQITALRRKIFRKVKPKQINGQFVTGIQLCELAESYTEAINRGGVPVIETAWQYVQSGELDNAYRDSVKLHEKLVHENIANNLPMSEEKLSKLLKEADQQGYDNYKSKTIGELTNTKNATYIQKLKQEFKSKKQIMKKKNVDQIKKVANHLFENLMQMSISQKIQQNMYPNISDIFADFNYVEQEFLQQMDKEFGLRDNLHAASFLNQRIRELQSHLAATLHSNICSGLVNQLKIANDRNGTLEEQHTDMKKNLTNYKQRYEEEVQELSEKKIQLSSQLAAIEQKLQHKDQMVEKMKLSMNQNTQELQSKNDELLKKKKAADSNIQEKEDEIRQIMTNNMRQQSEMKKQIALLEQKIEMQSKMQNEMSQNAEQKQDMAKQKNQELREFTELIKELQKENKGLRGQVKTAQGHIKSLEQNASELGGNTEELEKMQRENQKLKRHNQKLEGQIEEEQQEFIRLNQKLNLIQKQLKKQQEQKQQSPSKKDRVAETPQMMEEMEKLMQQLQTSQQSVKVLRRIKNAFKQASEVQCRGCGQKFNPVVFKAHIMNCEALMESSESFREIAENADFDQIHLKLLNFEPNSQCFVVNVKSSLTGNSRNDNGQVERTFKDRQMRFQLDTLQNLLIGLAEKYPDSDIQSNRNFERVIMADAHSQMTEQNEEEIKKNFNIIAPKLVQQHCIKQDGKFRKFFGLDGGSSESEQQPRDQPKSLSLLRQKGRK